MQSSEDCGKGVMMHPLFKKYDLKHLSASQVKTIKRSPFTWACQKLLKMRSGATEATAFGTFVHENFERRLVADPQMEVFISEEVGQFHVDAWTDKMERFYEDFRKLQPELPDVVEIDMEFQPDEELPPFIGRIDALTWSIVTKEGHEGPGLIQDHKTVGSKRYAPKTDEDLLDEDQLMIYAAWFLKQKPSRNGVLIQHDQLFKNIKRKPVNILTQFVTRKVVDERMAGICADARKVIEVLEVYDAGGIEEVAHVYKSEYEESKWDYGGCPLRDFFYECLKNRCAKIPKVVQSITRNEEDTVQDLHELVGKARNHFVAQGQQKFDLADSICDSVVGHIAKTGTTKVSLRAGMTNGGDLIYNQLLNRLAEQGIEVYERVR